MTETGSIYLIRNTVTGKIYVGQTRYPVETRWRWHINSANQERKRSNSYIQSAIHRYGPDAFTIEIIETCAIDALDDAETRWIAEYDSTNKQIGYNLRLGGNTSSFSPETRAKMSEAKKGKAPHNKGVSPSEKTREKIRQANLGKKASDEARQKMSVFQSSRKHRQPHTEEAKRKMSESLTGRTISEECKEKLRQFQARPEVKLEQSLRKKGKKLSAETRAKMSASRTGRKFSEESKQKMREAAIRREARKKAAKGETE